MNTLANPYCSLADVKQTLKLPLADTSKDDELIKAINLASRFIDDRQRRDFFYHDQTTAPLIFNRFSPSLAGRELFLPYDPIISITEVKVGTIVLVMDADFTAQGSILYNYFADWIPYYPNTGNVGSEIIQAAPVATLVSVKGTFGYAQATIADVPTGIPQQIRFCAQEIAAVFSGHHRKQVAGLDGTATEILTSSIPKTVLDILGRRNPIMI